MANEQNLIPAKKGEIRNPKGRPKGLPNAKTRYKRLLEVISKMPHPVTGEEEEFTQLEIMDMKIMQKALKGDIKAYEVIMDRLEGKATQPVDMSVAVDHRREILDKYGLGVKGAGQATQAENRPPADSA